MITKIVIGDDSKLIYVMGKTTVGDLRKFGLFGENHEE